MRELGATERARLRAAVAETLWDTCVIRSYDEGEADAYGLASSPVYTESAPMACGYRPTGAREVMGAAQVGLATGIVRLPAGVSVGSLDRIAITHQAGEELASPFVLAVVGEPLPAPTATLVRVYTVPDSAMADA